MTIAARIQIETDPGEFVLPVVIDGVEGVALNETAYHRAQHAELLAKARELGDVVRVEVEYFEERQKGTSWDESGDAVEIDFTVEPPTVTTLPPYADVEP